MAEINIEKKHRGAIWPWIVGLIVLLLIIWAIAESRHRDRAVAAAPIVTPPAVATGEVAGDVTAAPLTDVVTIVAVPVERRLPLVGQRVQLDSVAVQSVVGDETFWVGPSTTQQLFVALDPAPGLNRDVESPTDVNAGQQVNVTGVLRRVPASLDSMRTRWKLDAATVAALQDAQVYLAAIKVAVVSPR